MYNFEAGRVRPTCPPASQFALPIHAGEGWAFLNLNQVLAKEIVTGGSRVLEERKGELTV